MNNSEQTSRNEPRRKKRRFNKMMKVVRRIHMYLGLLLVPWVVLFGISGFFFNHTSTFWGGNVEELASFSAADIQKTTTFQPVELQSSMQSILQQINEESESKYELKNSPWISGHLKLAGKSGKETVNVSIDLSDGSTTATTQKRSTLVQDKPDFDSKQLADPILATESVAEQVKVRLGSAGINIKGELEPPTRGSSAEIRFVLTDSNGRDWRGSYDVATATLSGVADDSESGHNFYSTVTRLHKTHHYPDTIGAKWIWTAIGDITAISLVVWGLSGLVMWWQIQPTRVLGTVAVFAAAIVAIAIFSGTLADYTHNPVQVRSR